MGVVFQSCRVEDNALQAKLKTAKIIPDVIASVAPISGLSMEVTFDGRAFNVSRQGAGRCACLCGQGSRHKAGGLQAAGCAAHTALCMLPC